MACDSNKNRQGRLREGPRAGGAAARPPPAAARAQLQRLTPVPGRGGATAPPAGARRPLGPPPRARARMWTLRPHRFLHLGRRPLMRHGLLGFSPCVNERGAARPRRPATLPGGAPACAGVCAGADGSRAAAAADRRGRGGAAAATHGPGGAGPDSRAPEGARRQRARRGAGGKPWARRHLRPPPQPRPPRPRAAPFSPATHTTTPPTHHARLERPPSPSPARSGRRLAEGTFAAPHGMDGRGTARRGRRG
jgi:hypothetical protein